MEEAGLSRFEVLESGTRSVGRYVAGSLGLPGNFGTVEPGSRADLLLLEANPLDDLSNLGRSAGVMVAGRWVPASEIAAGLARIEAKYSGLP